MIAGNRRGLSDTFMDDLQTGILTPILKFVKADGTLSTSAAYLGFSILNPASLPLHISQQEEVTTWVEAIPQLKCFMDFWFGRHPKLEREYQQLVERSNNSNSATDYFICDIEYTNSTCRDLRADLVALRWLSTSAARRRSPTKLAIIEMKYADGALSSTKQAPEIEDTVKLKAGLKDHVIKLKQAVDNCQISFSELAEEMQCVFNQRIKLGLIDCHSVKNEAAVIKSIDENTPEFILLLADHDPEKTVLLRELRELESLSCLPFEIKVALASSMGYGLFAPYILPLSDFIERLANEGS